MSDNHVFLVLFTFGTGIACLKDMKQSQSNGSYGSELCAGLCIEEIRQLKIEWIRSVRNGEESCSYNFMPRFDGVPEEFFALDEIPWEKCEEANIPRSMRNYAQMLREKGASVEVSVAPRGIVCFRMLFRGKRFALWFNAWTSKTIVVGGTQSADNPSKPMA